jgi:hypothetical protein
MRTAIGSIMCKIIGPTPKRSRPTSGLTELPDLPPGDYWLLDEDIPIGADNLLIYVATYERCAFGDVPEGFATAGFILRTRLARGAIDRDPSRWPNNTESTNRRISSPPAHICSRSDATWTYND